MRVLPKLVLVAALVSSLGVGEARAGFRSLGAAIQAGDEVPAPGELLEASPALAREYLDERSELEARLVAEVPTRPFGAEEARLDLEVEGLEVLVSELACLSTLRELAGDSREALLHRLRALHLAVGFGTGVESTRDLATGLAIGSRAYTDLAGTLLSGALRREAADRMVRVVESAAAGALTASRLPGALARIRRRFEAVVADPEARREFGDHLEWFSARLAETPASLLDHEARPRIDTLAGRFSRRLGAVDDVPLLRGVGILVGRLEASIALARAAATLVGRRAREGRWPDPAGVEEDLPNDPLSRGRIRYRMVAGEPLLVSAGEDGRSDGGRHPEDLVAAPLRRRLEVEVARTVAVSFPWAMAPRLARAARAGVDPGPRGTTPSPSDFLPQECLRRRRELEAARAGFEREFDVLLREDPESMVRALGAGAPRAAFPRCPEGGTWTSERRKIGCSRHGL